MASTSELRSNPEVLKKSKSSSETGHAKNAANLGRLLACCNSFGATYNPSKPTITIKGLTDLQTKTNQTLNAIKQASGLYANALAAREELFAGFSKFVTRINNALKASSSSPEIDAKAKSIVQKIQGARSSAKLTNEEKKALEAQGKSTKEISSSQLSLDNRIDNFDKFITLLETIPEYNPNEPELKITALRKYLTDLRAKNDEVRNTLIELNHARLARNELFYKDISGMVNLSTDVKAYVKSVFGANTEQYKQVSVIEFKRYNN